MLERSTGTVIAGYRIDDMLGRGGMGIVYRATDLALERPVALKLIAPEHMEDEKSRERFGRELRYVASIDHPNVIPVHHAGRHEGVMFIVMRYVDGTDLGALMLEHAGGLEPQRAANIVAQVAMALDAAHARGVIHRDVKPANVLLERHGHRDHVYLTDFGLSRRLTSASGLTMPGQFVGTVDYVAPEQISGETVDGRADVYSLGCVLFHALTGHPPYAAIPNDAAKLWAHTYEPPGSVTELSSAPAAFDAVIARAMAKPREERYASPGELGRAALDAALPPPRPDDATRDTSLGPLTAAAAAPAVAAPSVPTEPPRAPAPAPAPPPPPTPTPTTVGSGELSPVVASPPQAPGRTRVGRTLPRVAIAGGAAAVALLLVVAAVAAFRPGGDDGGNESAGPAGPRVVSTIPVGSEPSDVTVGRDAVWVANGADGTLTRIDPVSERTRSIRAGDDPGTLAFGEGALWVADTLNRLDRLHPRTGERMGPPRRLATDPYDVVVDDGWVWLANGLKGTVTRLDAQRAAGEGKTIPVGQTPTALAVGAGVVWVVNTDGRSVRRIDAATGEPLGDPIPVGQGPSAVALAFGSAWVANEDGDTLTRIDAATGRVRGQPIRVGRRPSAVAAGADVVWVANAGSNTVSRIDPLTSRVVGPEIPVGRAPVAVVAGGGAVWVANADSNTVSRIEP